MSARSWFYTAGHDDDGNPIKKEEKLSSKQGIFDEAILRDFGSLEVEVSTIAAMKKLIDQLPQHRALHWIEELERIGAIAKTGNSAKLLSESEKLAPASGKGDQGGSK
jgi:uncharacterized ubiquitin-like protein YukD